MNLSTIEIKINEIISDSEDRHIVMWYDEFVEFGEEINNINLDNAELFVLDDDNWIYAKYYIESEYPNTNFLVYAPFRKPADEDNYLADMAHYATLFTADKINIICQELTLDYDRFKDVISLYSKFWNASSRIKAFKDLNIKDYTKSKIELGILAVLSKEKTLNFEYIVRKIIVNYFNDNHSIIESFEKYDILDMFWNFVYQRFGYTEENPTVEKFTVSLILNYTASLFEGEYPKAWKRFIIEDQNNARVFIDNFMNNTNYINIYNNISSNLEEKINVSNTIEGISVDEYIKCDSFKIFDRRIIDHYVNLLYVNKEKFEFNTILEERGKSHFYINFEDEYQLIHWANEFIGLINDFERELLPDDVNEFVDLYANKFVNVDKTYRKFYYHYDKIEDVDNLEELRLLIENMYSNTFLFEINSKFTSLFNNLTDISITKQWRFYKNFILNKKTKTVVIISDALRYGCGVELKNELDNNPTWTNTIQPMLSTVPSYTALGMAALLPNQEIKYKNNNILVDDKLCKDINDREKILQYYNSNSLAVKFDDINSLNQSKLRELTKGKDLVYIYHNQIDARGDNASTENEVFAASQEAIDEITKLVARLIDSANFVRVIITADHGYIYKRDNLEDSSKVNLESIGAFYKNKRFLLTSEETDISGTKCLSLDYIENDDVYVTVPKGVDIFKLPGAGLNYVHGGLSLEEVIVPVIEVKSRRGGKYQRTVYLRLIRSTKKITNYITNLSFFQEENISRTVLPLDAAIYFEDEDGNKISNEVNIIADRNSEYAEDRQFKEQFTLKRISYSKNKRYYLIIKNTKTDLEIDRYEFMIDIIFDDGIDFF